MQIKSAAKFTALMLALVAALFVNFGSRNASAQQTATASATPTPTPRHVDSMILTHGTGPNDGGQYIVKNAVGKPIKRRFELKPDFGWTNIDVLPVAGNKGTFFRPDQVADLRYMTDEDKALYTAEVGSVHGHGNGFKMEMADCDGAMPWDINMIAATNNFYNVAEQDYIELYAKIKNPDGSKTRERIAKLTWLGSTGLRVDFVHRFAQMYLGNRGASRWILQGDILPLYLVPSSLTPNSGWMYWPGLLGVSLNMKDMHSPFMSCFGVGAHVVNTVADGDQWFGFLDLVEMRKGAERQGDDLFYGGKGTYPSGEMCGETAACTPPPPAPICVKTINFLSPEDVLNGWCGHCDFPVPINSTQSVRYASWNAMSILMRGNGLLPLAGLKKLQANYGAGWVSINRADCNNLEWACILDSDLSLYGVQNTLGLRTVRDLFKKSESVLDPWSGDPATIDQMNQIYAALQQR